MTQVKMKKKPAMDLESCRILVCPSCFRTICKMKQPADKAPYLDFRHKYARLIVKEAIIKCIGCGDHYLVNAVDGIVQEVIVGD